MLTVVDLQRSIPLRNGHSYKAISPPLNPCTPPQLLIITERNPPPPTTSSNQKINAWHVCLPFCLSTSVLVYLSVNLAANLSLFTFLTVCRSTCLPSRPSVFLPVYLPDRLSVYLPDSLSVYLPDHLPIYLPAFLSLWLSFAA